MVSIDLQLSVLRLCYRMIIYGLWIFYGNFSVRVYFFFLRNIPGEVVIVNKATYKTIC